MSENRVDNAVETAWGEFESRLESLLGALGDDSMVIDVAAETTGGGAAPYVQFAGAGDSVRGEVSGNEFLDEACLLDAVQRRSLRALGWRRPDDQHPNWWTEVPRDELDLLMPMVVGALRQVLGVIHPTFLTWDGAAADEPEADVTEADEFPYELGFPSSPEELRTMVEATVADHLETGELVTDDDGDVAIRARQVPLWVRVLEECPTVRVFSHLLVDVTNTRQARIEVDILNRQHRHLKFTVEDRRIVATIDLPMAPFVAQHLRDMLEYADETLNELVDDLALRAGGKAFFNRRSPRSDRGSR